MICPRKTFKAKKLSQPETGLPLCFDEMEFIFDSNEKDDLSSEIEMLMDIVNIESSGGYLNEWRHGFNPKDPSITNASPAQRTKMLNDFH